VLSIPSRSPTDGLLSDPARLLALVQTLLRSFFCVLIGALFLYRRAPLSYRAPPALIALALVGTFVMTIAAHQPPTTNDWRVLALADGLLVAGLAFSIYSAASLGSCFGFAPEARGLVTSGAYRLVRHPLYLGESVTAFGLLLTVLAPLTVLVFVIFTLCQMTRGALEERVLAATFPRYAAYCQQTAAVIPWRCAKSLWIGLDRAARSSP
jgi:protein-S-isoprenylcysteine O-methyltransferase Ste14